MRHATQLLAEITPNQRVTDQVKNLLRLMLGTQTPSSAMIAEKLGISSRTLQRKLGEEGTQYKDVLNDLRLELALYFLKNTDLSLEALPMSWVTAKRARSIAALSNGPGALLVPTALMGLLNQPLCLRPLFRLLHTIFK